MSSGPQSCRDDEEDWYAFCKKTGADTRWGVYSQEAFHAKKLHEKHGYTHRELRLAVQHARQLDQLAMQHKNEWAELNRLIELEKKYV